MSDPAMRAALPAPTAIPFEVAARTVLDAVHELPVEQAPLLEALGRALAQEVHAPFDLPAFTNAAVDGFAVRSADLAGASPQSPVQLPVRGTVAAGPGRPAAHEPGTAVRIMTGAVVPEGADVALKVEDTPEAGGLIRVERPFERGVGVRFQGEELRRGALLLAAGTSLTPARVGLLANVGLAQVAVRRRPRVAVLTTGDELVEPGQPLGEGQIYNGNAYAMAAMVTEAGGIPVCRPIVADTPEQTRRSLCEALACDVVVSSGGVSMGGFDFVADTLRQLGEVRFAAVAQQPGKPMTFAIVEGKPFFGLPGNPVSTMVCFELYVRPALRKMQGYEHWQRPTVEARLAAPLRKDPGKTVFLRARVRLGPQGPVAELTGLQGSAMATSMAGASALLVVPAGIASLDAGAAVQARILNGEAFLP